MHVLKNRVTESTKGELDTLRADNRKLKGASTKAIKAKAKLDSEILSLRSTLKLSRDRGDALKAQLDKAKRTTAKTRKPVSNPTPIIEGEKISECSAI